ncbi:hypothetical protein A2619_02540 [candidate division WWE3 bacterium RIFOXYD1_FULL_39_9]|uniref:Uncharacterized protein n=1 Tax=candidate division WWE3 bacterium RIFOXYD1_FULL_39_9 TaxID=1802649 RepID=A0A1F4X5J8_UNCKA|nr:MAG: hypothetical protein A2619_02540 [candidate division WWE3 bacterium RIFOXYD1_FULL_39_9]
MAAKRSKEAPPCCFVIKALDPGSGPAEIRNMGAGVNHVGLTPRYSTFVRFPSILNDTSNRSDTEGFSILNPPGDPHDGQKRSPPHSLCDAVFAGHTLDGRLPKARGFETRAPRLDSNHRKYGFHIFSSPPFKGRIRF